MGSGLRRRGSGAPTPPPLRLMAADKNCPCSRGEASAVLRGVSLVFRGNWAAARQRRLQRCQADRGGSTEQEALLSAEGEGGQRASKEYDSQCVREGSRRFECLYPRHCRDIDIYITFFTMISKKISICYI